MSGIYGTDKLGRFGFASVQDWLNSVILSFPPPWSIPDLSGKYYGTEIADGDGAVILSVHVPENPEPSRRELAEVSDMDEDERRDYFCDCHHETVTALALAEVIVDGRNKIADDPVAASGDVWRRLTRHITENESVSWDGAVFEAVQCGGRLRRRDRTGWAVMSGTEATG